MKCKTLAVVILFTSFFLATATSFMVTEQPQSICHPSDQSHDSDTHTHSETCHSHRTHCCSHSLLFAKSIRPIEFTTHHISQFTEINKPIKPALPLDSPFQPPRL